MCVHGGWARNVDGSFAARAGASIAIPPFLLDLDNECLWHEGEPIKLKPKAFCLLRYLVEQPHRLVSKDELLRELWGGVHVGEAVLRTHLREIRHALDDRVKSPRFIETLHRRGYRFIGTIGSSSATRPDAEPPLAPAPPSDFVGRERELARLQAARGRAVRGRRQFVFVRGHAGAGKSSLIRAFLDRGWSAEQPLVWARCVDHYGVGEAYLPVLDALGRLAGGPWHGRWLELLDRFAPTGLSRLPHFWAASADPARGARGHVGAPERMLRELAEALEAFASDTPLLLVVEDVHWADRATLGLLSYLARRTDPVRLLVVCTYRPFEVGADEHPLSSLELELELMDHFHALSLSGLLPREVERYFAHRFEGNRFPKLVFQLAHRRTEGNPLLLSQIVEDWVKRRLLSRETGSWRLLAEARDLAEGLPDRVRSMLEREIERLCPLERGVLEAASVAGSPFSVATIATALGRDVMEVEDVCVRWARRGHFVHNAGVERLADGTSTMCFELRHALYQEAVCQWMGDVRRARLQLRIGER